MKKKDGIIHTSINSEDYTVVFKYVQEVRGHYVIAVPQARYLGDIHDMAGSIISVALVCLILSVLLLCLL